MLVLTGVVGLAALLFALAAGTVPASTSIRCSSSS